MLIVKQKYNPTVSGLKNTKEKKTKNKKKRFYQRFQIVEVHGENGGNFFHWPIVDRNPETREKERKRMKKK